MVSSSLTVAQKEYLASSSGKFVIIGGENAITPALEAQLQQYGTTERLGGSNRYKTSVLVAQRFFPEASQAVLAYGHNFPDGLCGGPLAYVLNAPLVLTRNENLAVTDEYASQTGISSGAVLGGPALISEATAIQILYP
jgi:putative cell wall-binding protein